VSGTWRLWRASAALLGLGLVVAGAWVALTGGPAKLAPLLRVRLSFLAPLLAVTALCLLARFVRWHFLLRRAGVRIPVRPSLVTFLASLVGIATPAYVGEVVRSVFLRRKFGSPVRVTASVLVLERLLDVAALGTIGALTADGWWLRNVMLLLVAAAGLIGVAGTRLARSLGVPAGSLAALGRPGTLAPALAMSLAAWVPAALLVSLAAASVQVPVAPASGMRVFSSATLLGALTLMPAGVGATGSLAIVELQDLGIALADAVVIVSLVRLTTTGVSLTVGAAFLVLELKGLARPAARGARLHFDEIASKYGKQFSPHVWNHLLEKKVRLLAAALPDPSSAAGFGLDLGCGLGEQCLAMRGRGYRVIGVDAAHNLVRRARAAGATVATASGLALPFRDASLAYVYTVGVLHHLEGTGLQRAACREIARALKPGGLLVVHETNPRNPLFRFYMGYVFPILKSIDVGTERWIEPERWKGIEGLDLVDVQYFTFLPDFVPRGLMRPALALERRLEASRARVYSVHYLAVLRKEPRRAVAPEVEGLRGAARDPTGPHGSERDLVDRPIESRIP
jgi:SAM-dependent methyltransferase